MDWRSEKLAFLGDVKEVAFTPDHRYLLSGLFFKFWIWFERISRLDHFFVDSGSGSFLCIIELKSSRLIFRSNIFDGHKIHGFRLGTFGLLNIRCS